MRDTIAAATDRRDRGGSGVSGRQVQNIDLSSLLADAPSMFGHFYQTGWYSLSPWSGDLPLGAACGRLSVVDNNKALTQDRIYLAYNHFHNAFETMSLTSVLAASGSRVERSSIDRFTLGIEKTLFDGLWSVEARLPFANGPDFAEEFDASLSQNVVSGDMGNLSVILKRMLWVGESACLAAGMGLETPTGSNAAVRRNISHQSTDYLEVLTVHDQAIYLVPYVGLLVAPSDGSFFQGFLQVNVPTCGNAVDYLYQTSAFSTVDRLGVLTPPTLLHVDFSVGRWLYRAECPRCGGRGGLAAVAEFHYVTALSDVDAMGGVYAVPLRTQSADDLQFRQQVADLTVGLHVAIPQRLPRPRLRRVSPPECRTSNP